jgi:hypothetical protein
MTIPERLKIFLNGYSTQIQRALITINISKIDINANVGCYAETSKYDN